MSDEKNTASSAANAAEPETAPTTSERSSSKTTPPDTFASVEASWGYPAFATDFPRHPELDALVAAFARGDYRTVRARAPKLAAVSTDESVKRAAELLRARIEPDPASKFLFLFAGALLAILTIWWVTHDGPDVSHLAP